MAEKVLKRFFMSGINSSGSLWAIFVALPVMVLLLLAIGLDSIEGIIVIIIIGRLVYAVVAVMIDTRIENKDLSRAQQQIETAGIKTVAGAAGLLPGIDGKPTSKEVTLYETFAPLIDPAEKIEGFLVGPRFTSGLVKPTFVAVVSDRAVHFIHAASTAANKVHQDGEHVVIPRSVAVTCKRQKLFWYKIEWTDPVSNSPREFIFTATAATASEFPHIKNLNYLVKVLDTMKGA